MNVQKRNKTGNKKSELSRTNPRTLLVCLRASPLAFSAWLPRFVSCWTENEN